MGLRFLYLVAVFYCCYDRGGAQNQTEDDLSDLKIWWIGRNLREDVNSERIIDIPISCHPCNEYPTGELPHPTDCTKFIECGYPWGGARIFNCPPNTYFNPTSNKYYPFSHRWEIPCYIANYYNSDGSCKSKGDIIKCGVVKAGRRIVGGQAAQPHQYPWMATIVHRKDPGLAGCGGSLITSKYVLTAAHCFKSRGEYHNAVTIDESIIYLGHHKLSKAKPSYRHYPKRIIIHGKYRVSHLPQGQDHYEDYGQSTNDIALVELTKVVKFSDSISPVCLPPSRKNFNYQGDSATVIGYGNLYHAKGQENRPDVLKVVNQKTYSHANCKKINDYQNIPTSTFCAGHTEEGKGFCSGDSGGPLMVMDGSGINRQYFQIGIASAIKDCGKPNEPGVFTKVKDYLSWIDKNTYGGCSEAKVLTKNNKDKICM